MDNAPWFDHPDQFDQRRIRLADIDGSGTTDIIYLHRDGVRLYFNQSGNSWSAAAAPARTSRASTTSSSVMAADLLGNGTACLVWSSPLPGDARRPMRYVDLMGGQKPHLLVKIGQQPRRRDPRPVRAVDQVLPAGQARRASRGSPGCRSRCTWSSASRPTTTSAATASSPATPTTTATSTATSASSAASAWSSSGTPRSSPRSARAARCPTATNVDAASHVPPVLTRTWFHTGVYLGRDHVSDFFAGLLDADDAGEYYREPGLTDAQARALLLDDTVLPAGSDRRRKSAKPAARSKARCCARRSTRSTARTRQQHPYTVTEQNFTIRRAAAARRATATPCSSPTPREAISYHYERNPADPRISHALTLEVDDFGNVLQVSRHRLRPPAARPCAAAQSTRTSRPRRSITYTENAFTNAIDDVATGRLPHAAAVRDAHLRADRLRACRPARRASASTQVRDDAVRHGFAPTSPTSRPPTATSGRSALIEHVRTLYRRDDLTALAAARQRRVAGAARRELQARLHARAARGRSTAATSRRDCACWRPRAATSTATATTTGGFPPGGSSTRRTPTDTAGAGTGLRPRSTSSCRTASATRSTRPAFDNRERRRLRRLRPADRRNPRRARQRRDAPSNDYRVLQPRLITDPNGNRTEVAFDALGMVVGTAVMGKPEREPGRLAGRLRRPTWTRPTVARPPRRPARRPARHPAAAPPRGSSTTCSPTSARETEPEPAAGRRLHPRARDPRRRPGAGEQTKIQHSFSYSDGFGREIQKKIQAEPGPLVDGRAGRQPALGRQRLDDLQQQGQAGPPVRAVLQRHASLRVRTSRSASARSCSTTRSGASSPRCTQPHLGEGRLRSLAAGRPGTSTTPSLIADPETRPRRRRLLPPPARRATTCRPGTRSALAARSAPQEQAAARQGRRPCRHARPSPTSTRSGRTFLTVAHNRFKRSDAPPGDPPDEEFHAHARRARHRRQPARRHRRRWTASSCATTTTCSATASTRPAWKPASAGC